MKLGMVAAYGGAKLALPMDLIKHAEKIGFDSVWFAEAWGSDVVSPIAWVLAQTEKIRAGSAIMQMPARVPTCAAMTAMTLDQLSGGRFILGLGPSGPQVVEGWYGQPYGRPLTRTREYVDIMRKVWAREEKLTHEGFHYSIPYKGEDGTGLGKPLKSILHSNGNIPIYTASINAKSVATSAEIADGFFPIWLNPERFDLFKGPIEEGLAKAGGGKSLENYDVAPFVNITMGDNVESCRKPTKMFLALYIGGMGARNKNFYNDYAKRMGYEEAAVKIQDLYLDGKKGEAANEVPDELVDEIALVGPKERIVERLQAWKEAGKRNEVGSMLLSMSSPEAYEVVANEVL